MTSSPEEILRGLFDETLVGNAPRVLELTEEGLAAGMEPQTLLFEALIPSLEEVGARFERGDFFVPEMLIAGRAMAGALEHDVDEVLADVVHIALDRAHQELPDGLDAGLGQERTQPLHGPGHRPAGDQHLGHEEVTALEASADLLQRRDESLEKQGLGLHAERESLLGELEDAGGVADQRLVVEASEDVLGSHLG